MHDYNRYMESVSITQKDVSRVLSRRFRLYQKGLFSVCCSPKAYGIMLTPEAEQALADSFGAGEGLASVKKPKHSQRRRKNTAVSFRMDDFTATAFLVAKQAAGVESSQAFLEQIVNEYLTKDSP